MNENDSSKGEEDRFYKIKFHSRTLTVILISHYIASISRGKNHGENEYNLSLMLKFLVKSDLELKGIILAYLRL